MAEPSNGPAEEKQCRICLDGLPAERELGRLIRPCLCKGSISYVHIKCLQRWRTTASSNSAFFSCPQCHYRYRFTRTRVAGIATNPVIVGGLSGIIFTCIVMLASFITTFFLSAFEEPTYYYSPFIYVSPLDLAQDLITATLRILKEGDIVGPFNEGVTVTSNTRSTTDSNPSGSHKYRQKPSLLKNLIRRFILGLPMVGAGSLVHMLLSAPLLGPLQWLARQRGSRRRRDQSRDIAAMIIIVLIVVGAARALYKVFQITESATKRFLLRAEDVILEVN